MMMTTSACWLTYAGSAITFSPASATFGVVSSNIIHHSFYFIFRLGQFVSITKEKEGHFRLSLLAELRWDFPFHVSHRKGERD